MQKETLKPSAGPHPSPEPLAAFPPAPRRSLAALPAPRVSEELPCVSVPPHCIPHTLLPRFTHLAGSQKPTNATLPGGLVPKPLSCCPSEVQLAGPSSAAPSAPRCCLSLQQVRPDCWGVCRRLHPGAAADPNMPTAAEHRLQKAGARTKAELGAGKMSRETESLPQQSSGWGLGGCLINPNAFQTSLCRQIQTSTAKVLTCMQRRWKNHNKARATAFCSLNGSEKESRNLRAG